MHYLNAPNHGVTTVNIHANRHPAAQSSILSKQRSKRPFNEPGMDVMQQNKQPWIPNTATVFQAPYEEEIDYNDIHSLRAYAIRTQSYQYFDEYENEQGQPHK